MSPPMLGTVLVFALDDSLYALPLPSVERVIRAVEITALPGAPRIVLGVIDARGRIIPVLDIRMRLGLPERELACDDRFIVARGAERALIVAVDRVVGIREFPEGEVVGTESVLPFAHPLRGIARLEDGLVLIYDLDSFIALDEERMLDAALPGDSA
jgi:purine-binding chemotaxis protein CheW